MINFRLGYSWGVVVAFLVLGTLVTLLGSLRVGGVIMSCGLFAGAAMRLVMPQSMTPSIAIRTRAIDAVIYSAFGIALLAIVLTVKL